MVDIPEKPPIDVDEVLKNFDTEAAEEKKPEQQVLTPESIASVIRMVTAYVARLSGEPDLEINDAEYDMLVKGLEPFKTQLDKILKLLPYLPIMMFGVAYGIRVATVLSKRKKETAKRQMSKLQKQARQLEKERQKEVPQPPMDKTVTVESSLPAHEPDADPEVSDAE